MILLGYFVESAIFAGLCGLCVFTYLEHKRGSDD
jgi:hypothetical protein